MKKHIDTCSYWLGLVSALIALAMRTFNAFGVWLPGTVVQGMTIWYMSFYKAALLFLLINIATAMQIQRPNAAHDDHVVVGGSVAGKFRTAKAGI